MTLFFFFVLGAKKAGKLHVDACYYANGRANTEKQRSAEYMHSMNGSSSEIMVTTSTDCIGGVLHVCILIERPKDKQADLFYLTTISFKMAMEEKVG